MKQDNFAEQTLEVLSYNRDDSYHSSSTINLCRYLVENYEEEFITVAGYSGLTFSGHIQLLKLQV